MKKFELTQALEEVQKSVKEKEAAFSESSTLFSDDEGTVYLIFKGYLDKSLTKKEFAQYKFKQTKTSKTWVRDYTKINKAVEMPASEYADYILNSKGLPAQFKKFT